MSDPTQIPFQEVIRALLDTSQPFRPLYLFRLSGLSENESKELAKNWHKVPLQRRQLLMEDIEEFSETDPLLSFDAVCRISLEDSDPVVRRRAISALWEDDSPAHARKLLQLMEKDSDAEVRAAATSALGYFIYLGEIDEFPRRAFREIEEKLLHTIHSREHPLVRRRALEALGFSCRPELTPLIEEAFHSDDDDWIISALFAMGRSANAHWSEHVVDMLSSTNPLVRFEAARAAGELEIGEAVPTLLDMLEDEDEDVRAAAIWSLSQIGGGSIREALETLLEVSDDEDEIDLILAALDNLEFTEGLRSFDLFNFSEDDLLDFGFDDLEA